MDYCTFVKLFNKKVQTLTIMDRFSFLNAAHTEFFAQLYDQYLENPDSVEPSWRSFFQGFDFGMANLQRRKQSGTNG